MSKVLQNRIGKLNYLRFEPANFSEDKKYPVIIHFHGAGSRGDNVEILKNQMEAMMDVNVLKIMIRLMENVKLGL